MLCNNNKHNLFDSLSNETTIVVAFSYRDAVA